MKNTPTPKPLRSILTSSYQSGILLDTVSITMYPHYVMRDGVRCFAGTYIIIPESLCTSHISLLVGMHSCLVLTLRRPPTMTTILEASTDLPAIEPFGPVVWLGSARENLSNGRAQARSNSVRFYLPQTVWALPDELARQPIYPHGYIQNLRDLKNRSVMVIHLPGFLRSGITTSLVPTERSNKTT
jgi:hypothetical protein